MLGNYLQSALRNALHNPLYAIINVVGLAIGLACFALILLFVLDETSYDQHWAEADNLYRVGHINIGGPGAATVEYASISPAFAPYIKSDIPEVQEFARLMDVRALFSRGDNRFYQDGFYYADPALLRIFDFEFVEGDPDTALAEPSSLVLTETTAAKYFGNESGLGQTLNYGGLLDLKVTGIIRDLPGNTHLNIKMLASMDTLYNTAGQVASTLLQSWGSNTFYTYFLLEEGASPTDIEEKLAGIMLRNTAEQRARASDQVLHPVSDIHLHSNAPNEMKPAGDIDRVYMLSAIAAGILIIAVINFANLTTARGTLRAREIGVRKVSGATRIGIAGQIFLESGLFVVMAILLAIGMIWDTLPWFNSFTDKNIELAQLFEPEVLLSTALLAVIVTTLAGAWPAAFLSRMVPASVIKGGVDGSTDSGKLRKALVVLQFSVSVGLGIATATVFQQMEFARNLALGYQTEDIVLVRYNVRRSEQVAAHDTLFTEWRNHPGIMSVTSSDYVPTGTLFSGFDVYPEGGDPVDPRELRVVEIDYDFFKTFSIGFAAGQGFSRDRSNEALTQFGSRSSELEPSASGAVVINERAVQSLGLGSARNAIGKQIILAFISPAVPLTVIGVTPDIYFTSVHTAIQPQMYILTPGDGTRIAIRLTGDDRASALQHIDDTWNRHVPSYPIVRTFLSDQFDALYLNEERAAQIFSMFTGIAFVVAALGLFGLAAFTMGRRTKEVGVRKVLGATVPGIIATMTWDFSKLVIVASVIATPFAWFATQRWLEGFAYRTSISPMIFGGAILAAFALSSLVVLFHATKAASAPPALSLRDE